MPKWRGACDASLARQEQPRRISLGLSQFGGCGPCLSLISYCQEAGCPRHCDEFRQVSEGLLSKASTGGWGFADFRTANLAMTRCTKLASPCHQLPEIAIPSLCVTRLSRSRSGWLCRSRSSWPISIRWLRAVTACYLLCFLPRPRCTGAAHRALAH